MSSQPVKPPLPLTLLCLHCHEPIEPDPQKRIFIIVGADHPPNEPVLLHIQAADIPLAAGVAAFGSIVCIKKWLLDRVDEIAAWKATVDPPSDQATTKGQEG
jgi:hypothetical protein